MVSTNGYPWNPPPFLGVSPELLQGFWVTGLAPSAARTRLRLGPLSPPPPPQRTVELLSLTYNGALPRGRQMTR